MKVGQCRGVGLDKEEKLILSIVKSLVCGSSIKNGAESVLSQEEIDWARFKELAIYHDLTPFVYIVLKDFDAFVPEDLSGFFKNNYYCALARCQNIWQEFLRIQGAFKQVRITIVPIKGVALLEDIYTSFPVRPMTDIDLLVKEEDIPRAETVFEALGYKKELYGLKEEYWRESQCHITFYKTGDDKAPFVELHWGIDFKRRSRVICPELWERIRTIDAGGRAINLLSVEDTLFSLALHNRRFGRTLCLKNAYDLVLLLNKYASSFDWGYVLRQSKKYGLCSTVYFILSQAKLLLELKIPKFVWAKLNLPAYKRRIIGNFIEKNTFLPEKKRQGKNLYLKSHFLLYDTFWEPIEYILNIPQEQFAKYYSLSPYDKKTSFFYKNRLFYIIFKCLMDKKWLSGRKYKKLMMISFSNWLRRLRLKLAILKARYYDRKLGIDAEDNTSSPEEDPSFYKDMAGYQPAFYGRIEKMAAHLKLTPDDVFVDLGCGKGRVIFFVATYKLKKVIGVELDKNLFAIAKKNLNNLRIRNTPVELINSDAAYFDGKEATIFYLFNPFGNYTFWKVINKIEESLSQNPRRIRIVYYSPVYKDSLDKQDWLIRDGQIENENCLVWRSK